MKDKSQAETHMKIVEVIAEDGKAEMVALAVNNHDKLVEALEYLLPLAEAYHDEMDGESPSLGAYNELLQAIKGDQ